MNRELLKEWLIEHKEETIKNLKQIYYNNIQYSNLIQILSNKIGNNQLESIQQLRQLSSQLLEKGVFFRQEPSSWLIAYSFEEYCKKFYHLFNTNIPVEDRLDAAIYDTPYQLSDFSIQEITDFIYHNTPKELIRFEPDFQPFIDNLELENAILNKQKSNSYGQFFSAFNEVIQEEVLELYCEIFYGKKSTEIAKEDLYSKISLMYEIGGFISETVLFKMSKFNNGFISSISLADFYSINKNGLEFKKLQGKKIIFLLGENGTGKTVLLKAILIALKKSFIQEHTSKEETGLILQILAENKSSKLDIAVHKEINQLSYKFDEWNRFYLLNCYAYGTQRNKISQSIKAESYGFMSLFKPDEFMTNVESWLLTIERKELKGEKTIGIQGIERILGQILDYPDLKILIKENGVGEVFFKIQHGEYKLRQLSEGFQTIMIFIIDLLFRLTSNNPTITDTKDFKAVVLIDELDLFLHPKWEKNICGKLHKIFPNIQFFITTHSPILVDGAVKDKRIDNTKIEIVKLGLQDGSTVIERTYTGDLIENWTPNLLINSQMFDDDYLNDLDDEQLQSLSIKENELELLQTAKRLKIVSNREEELKQRFLNRLNNKAL